MIRFIDTRIRGATALCGLAGSPVLLLSAGQAQAATSVYPAGGSTFTGGARRLGSRPKPAATCRSSAPPAAATTAPTATRRARSRPTRPSAQPADAVQIDGDAAVAGLHGRRALATRTLHLDRAVRLRLAWSTWRRRAPTTVTLIDRTGGDQIGSPHRDAAPPPSGFIGKDARGDGHRRPHLRDLDHERKPARRRRRPALLGGHHQPSLRQRRADRRHLRRRRRRWQRRRRRHRRRRRRRRPHRPASCCR